MPGTPATGLCLLSLICLSVTSRAQTQSSNDLETKRKLVATELQMELGVPQGTGGGIEVFPHAQEKLVKIVSRQGGQWPLWQSSWQKCFPHCNFFPQEI